MAKRTTKETLATKTVIETPPVVPVVPVKNHHALADLVKKPLHALLTFIWDDKTNTLSTARLILIIGNVFVMKIMWEVHDMIKEAVYAGREVPDLSWYYIEIVGYLVAINTPYFRSKGSSRMRRTRGYPSIPEEDE